MVKRYAVLVLIIILLANPSFAFETEKLLKLDPLVSKRIEKLADNSRNARNNVVLGYSVLGLGFLGAGALTEDKTSKAINSGLGVATLISAGIICLMPSETENEYDKFRKVDREGIEKELAAYESLKMISDNVGFNRKFVAIFGLIMGPLYISLSGSEDYSETRTFLLCEGTAILVLSIYRLFVPLEEEREYERTSKELGQ